MKLERVLQFTRSLMKKAIEPGDIAIDGTVGNGYDTVFLATLVGEAGHVFGFDVQDVAIKTTKERLRESHLLDRVTLYAHGHERLARTIDEKFTGKITAAVFNLGYLPGSDKTITTTPITTIAAIEQLLDIMAAGGIIVLVVYHGHEEGARERDALLKYVSQIDQEFAHVLQYQFVNQQNNPPFILAIEKK